jgi:DNA-binding NarL/FixJ family response regulator
LRLELREAPPNGAASRTAETVRAVIVDDQALVREALPPLLERHGIDVVASVASPADALACVEEHRPLVTLIGIPSPERAGLELARRLSTAEAPTYVLLYCSVEGGLDVATAFSSGAAGVVSKSSSLADLPQAIRTVAGGGLWFDESLEGSDSLMPRSARLSPQELRVLTELARGISTEDIAELLHLSPHTVRTHIKNIMRKLESSTRAHAVAIALTEGAIEARV